MVKKKSNNNLPDIFYSEMGKVKYRKVSKSWIVEQVDDEMIVVSNEFGGRVVFRKSEVSRNRQKYLLEITSARETSRKRINFDLEKLIVYLVNYLRCYPQN